MIESYIERLYNKVFRDLYTGSSFESSFDLDILVWIRFKLEVESLQGGVTIPTMEYLTQYLIKADNEISEIQQLKTHSLGNPEAKMLWENLFGKSK